MRFLKTLCTFLLHLQQMHDLKKKKRAYNNPLQPSVFLAAAIIAFSNYGHLVMHEVSRPCYLLPPQ